MYYPAGGRLLGVAEGAGAQQALPRARGGQPVLHRAAQVPDAGAAGGPLPARAHLHQQGGREALPRAAAAQGHAALLSGPRPSRHTFCTPVSTIYSLKLVQSFRVCIVNFVRNFVSRLRTLDRIRPPLVRVLHESSRLIESNGFHCPHHSIVQRSPEESVRDERIVL